MLIFRIKLEFSVLAHDCHFIVHKDLSHRPFSLCLLHTLVDMYRSVLHYLHVCLSHFNIFVDLLQQLTMYMTTFSLLKTQFPHLRSVKVNRHFFSLTRTFNKEKASLQNFSMKYSWLTVCQSSFTSMLCFGNQNISSKCSQTCQCSPLLSNHFYFMPLV